MIFFSKCLVLSLSITTHVPCLPFYFLPIESSLYHFNPLYHYTLSLHSWQLVCWLQGPRYQVELESYESKREGDGLRGGFCPWHAVLGLGQSEWKWEWDQTHLGLVPGDKQVHLLFKLCSLCLRAWALKHNPPKLGSMLVQLIISYNFGHISLVPTFLCLLIHIMAWMVIGLMWCN